MTIPLPKNIVILGDDMMCETCENPLISFEWNSKFNIVTCDNSSCLGYRRPMGVKEIEIEEEDNPAEEATDENTQNT